MPLPQSRLLSFSEAVDYIATRCGIPRIMAKVALHTGLREDSLQTVNRDGVRIGISQSDLEGWIDLQWRPSQRGHDSSIRTKKTLKARIDLRRGEKREAPASYIGRLMPREDSEPPPRRSKAYLNANVTSFHILGQESREPYSDGDRPISAPVMKHPVPQPGSASLPHVYKTGVPGKPTSWHLVERECRRRYAAGERHPNKIGDMESSSEWARVLLRWLVSEHSDAAIPTEKTLTNKLPGLLRELKAQDSFKAQDANTPGCPG